MKKILFSILIFCGLILNIEAAEILSLPYKSIKPETKLKLVNNIWTDSVSKKDSLYIIKFINEDDGYSEYYSSDGKIYFNTGCEYDFLYKGSLIGYSNHDLKFYKFYVDNEEVYREELTENDVHEMFPKFKLVMITDFSKNTNSLKIKKVNKDFKIILLNNTGKTFDNYFFTSGNGKFKNYPLAGFLKITKKGMFHFSNSTDKQWYVLLIR